MGKLMLEYLYIQIVKGRQYNWYRRNGKYTKLPFDTSSLEFHQRYNQVHDMHEGKGQVANVIGGIASMIIAYKQSSNFKNLKPRVRQLYLSALDPFQEKYGHLAKEGVTKRFLLEWRDKMQETPGKANCSVTAIKAVFAFCEERGIVKHNPAQGIKKLKVGEWRPWTQEEIELFDNNANDRMRLALYLALYTGQRQGDVRTAHWNHIENRGIKVVQEKTDKRLWVPMHTKLAAMIDGTTKVSVMILASVTGKPYSKRNLSEEFKEECRRIGLPEDCVFHGLRKSACVRLVEAGCTSNEVQAITGQSLKMIEHYTKMANQKKLALTAMGKLEIIKESLSRHD